MKINISKSTFLSIYSEYAVFISEQNYKGLEGQFLSDTGLSLKIEEIEDFYENKNNTIRILRFELNLKVSDMGNHTELFKFVNKSSITI